MGWFVVAMFVVMVGRGAYLIASRVMRQPEGVSRTLAATVLAWSWVTIGGQVLGTLGFLNQPSLLALAALGLILGSFCKIRDPAADVLPPASPRDFFLRWMAISFMVGSAMLIGLPSALLPPKIVSDGPIYHLFFAAKWWKAGRIFLIASPFGENAATYFPANGDLWFSILMTLFGGDRLARVGQSPFLAMAGLGSFGISRVLGAGRTSSILASAWAISSFALLLFAFEANVDTIFIAGYLATVFFGLRYAVQDGGPAALVLAGLSAGLAWGTKPTATAFVPPLLVLGSLVILTKRTGWRSTATHLAILLGGTLLTCGFWFGRNLILTGNPLYPMHVEALGRVWLSGWYRSSAMVRSQFYLPMTDWRALVAILMAVFDARMIPLWILALLGAWSWGRPVGRLDRWVWGISALSVANIAIYWLAIPYRTQQRFMLQAMGLAAAPLALLLDRSAVWRWLALALLGLHLVTNQSWPFAEEGGKAFWEVSEYVPSIAATPVTMALSPRQWVLLSSRPEGLAYLGGIAAIVAGGFVIGWFWTRAFCRGSRRPLAVACVVSLMGVSSTAALLDLVAGGLSQRTYPTFREYQRAWLALESLSPPEGTNVAYAGTNLPLMLMAGGHRNDVWYVNVDDHPGWLLHDYHLKAADRGDPSLWYGPRPGWDRIHPRYEAWLDNLRRRGITLLVVARANPVDGIFNLADNEGFPIERVWADLHPEVFTRVYPREGPDPEMRIYRLDPKKS